MTAIVLDDSDSVRQRLRDLLAEQGYDVVEFENGYDALERLVPEMPPQIAFVDRQMPIMDGLDFVQAVRADSRFNSMRIVMCSGPLSLNEKKDLPPGAIDHFLPKPLISRDSVIKALDLLLRGQPVLP